MRGTAPGLRSSAALTANEGGTTRASRPFAGREAFCISGEGAMDTERTNGKVSTSTKKRLLTGLRPTGKFHLGNYVGTFEKDVELQNSGEYECFFLIADLHSLTT